MAGSTFTDTWPLIEAHVAGFQSDVADNIVRVENAGVIESETRYETNPFSPNFDKVARQRWGSTFTNASASVGDFLTTLPEATFAYGESGAVANGADDRTTKFLETVIASRYPLEPLAFAAEVSAQEKGMLLDADSR